MVPGALALTLALGGSQLRLPVPKSVRWIESETRTILTALRGSLEEAGSSMDRVLKCTVFLADMFRWEARNGLYQESFAENRLGRGGCLTERPLRPRPCRDRVNLGGLVR